MKYETKTKIKMAVLVVMSLAALYMPICWIVALAKHGLGSDPVNYEMGSFLTMLSCSFTLLSFGAVGVALHKVISSANELRQRKECSADERDP